MKMIISLLFLISALPSFALTRAGIEKLLQNKNLSLSTLEAKGSQVLLGEVTGHGRVVPMSKVEAIITDHEAILRHEIETVTPDGLRSLSQIDSLRANGQYILKEEVRATIISR